ncbi:hypothetical protein NEMBOFW57_004608 [Staphylotrichum longicolle]|uniref:Azaphilone pigments biosynthesis cluster protein L N-terminal domain-containing protein n=1 Tax=Staphylotrichum longicolle TaxID=669026 RepID=A0AAD4FC06_9PEZI|nr:hypothetical protein NEMBOFW57_004608 [Staphylotrichum longicolle]
MDPLSITSACLALLSAVGKTSIAVTSFIRGCREARSDLTSISGELTQLQLVLDLLKDDASVGDDRVIPESLQTQILSIIKNCSAVVDNINTVLEKHSGRTGVPKWVAFGKAEVAGLRMSLEAHRGSLSLVLELVSVSVSKAILDDVGAVRNDVHDIKQDTGQIPQIMAELTRLRAIVAAGDIPSTARGQNYVLEQYLDSLTSYAETVCNDVVWDSDGSRHTLSRKPSMESIDDSREPADAHSRGATAELPSGQDETFVDNDSLIVAANSRSQIPQDSAILPTKSAAVAYTTVSAPAEPAWTSDFLQTALMPVVHAQSLGVSAGVASALRSLDLQDKSLTTAREESPKLKVAHALDSQSLPTTMALRDYDPYNYASALTRHASPAAQPSTVVILPHQDPPVSVSGKQPDTTPALNHSRQPPEALATSEGEAKHEAAPAAPVPAILPVVEDQVVATTILARPTSSAAEIRRKIFIVGDGAVGKSTLYM